MAATDSVAMFFAQGLPFDERWGGYIVSEANRRPDGSGALKVAAIVLEAAVRHPEWAVAAVQELRVSGGKFAYPAEEVTSEADRLVRLAFIPRSEQ